MDWFGEHYILMAHFAQLDNDNTVLQVIVIHNNELYDANGMESEALGVQFCQSLFGDNTIWVQTSYNTSFRKNFAGIGFYYDHTHDAFIPPKPYNSWILNEATCIWEAPIPYPQDNETYQWDEILLTWQGTE